MWSTVRVLITLWMVFLLTCLVVGNIEYIRSQEALEEARDVEIHRAVVNSIREWEHNKKFKSKQARYKRQDTSVCYPDLGCFESSGPFGYLDMLPNTPEEISTTFLLYPFSKRRRRSGTQPIEIPFSNITDAFDWSTKNFNGTLPTKVMIHGFGSDCSHIWVYEMRSALLEEEDVNVICVDWTNGATLPNYVKASANTRLVGKQLAIFLKGLSENVGLPLENMHLIGFSLGAHVAGFAGSELGNLSRITGLDPAGPLFESQDPRARLDQSDAAFVDVIHSNGENLILGGLGSWQPMGHVDFYPNGGRMQKGCTNLFVGALTDIIWSAGSEGRSLCNHRRAYKFFTDSIYPRCHFPAFPCDSYDDFLAGHCFPCTEKRKCGNMGYYADRLKGRGQLYLLTRDEEPFCAHQYLVKIESSPTEVPIVSYGRIQVTLIGDTLLNETFTLTKKEDEEMRLGESISKIIVPHPILLPPSHVQVLYTSYNGWLTSGLHQWKIDKISFSDSYGKSLSVCRKNLILESGVHITLPLFDGDCNIFGEDNERQYAEDRLDDKHRSKFVPNLIEEEKNNSISKIEANDRDNTVDTETESSRAFNTRHVKSASYDHGNNSNAIREVVEPILKAQATKNARAHNPDKERPEITEPILGPTTSNYGATTKESKIIARKEKETVFRDEITTIDKWKREDESKSASINFNLQPQRQENGFDALVRTVQFLPQRIARMFEDAEKYARETILPFVSTYTPRFISDFINPRDRDNQRRYVPLHFEETVTTTKKPKQTTTKATTTSSSTTFSTTTTERKPLKDDSSNAIHTKERQLSLPSKPSADLTSPREKHEGESTTPYTHIQKIQKKTEKVAIVYPENSETMWAALLKTAETVRAEKLKAETTTVISQSQRSINGAKRSVPNEIYVNLPVFEDDYKSIKYIPLSDESR
ncbi:uncharacterized protein [Onthophagus taurus]|uniref:uncharacterized protein n=1 Tax=Onthophagus taurus TaxID=166361 RepID=UPI0039BDDC36